MCGKNCFHVFAWKTKHNRTPMHPQPMQDVYFLPWGFLKTAFPSCRKMPRISFFVIVDLCSIWMKLFPVLRPYHITILSFSPVLHYQGKPHFISLSSERQVPTVFPVQPSKLVRWKESGCKLKNIVGVWTITARFFIMCKRLTVYWWNYSKWQPRLGAQKHFLKDKKVRIPQCRHFILAFWTLEVFFARIPGQLSIR